jgi:hypothetical protein
MELEFLIRALKAITEVALLSLIGQGIVGLLAGASRDNNFVFVLFRIIASPFTKLVRFVLPKKLVLDRFIPYITFGVLIWAWGGLIIWLAVVRGSPA